MFALYIYNNFSVYDVLHGRILKNSATTAGDRYKAALVLILTLNMLLVMQFSS